MDSSTNEISKICNNTLSAFDKIGIHTPAEVFHYTSPDGLLGITKEDNVKLFFTQYDSLNDKNERLDVIESLVEYCTAKVNLNVISNELLNRVKNIKPSDLVSVTKEIKETTTRSDGAEIPTCVEMEYKDCYTYLCCFSQHPDSLSMWNYYSKSKHYEGYSLGIIRSHLSIPFYKSKEYTLELKEVIYDKEDKFKMFEKYLLPIFIEYDKSSDQMKNFLLNIIIRAIESVQFIFKNSHFSHEEEVRAILRVSKEFVSDNLVSERKFRSSNGYIVPYVELTLSKNDLRHVVTAPLFEKELAVKNLESMLKQKGFSNTQVVPSSIPIRF